jgi:hypothetical protein
MQKCAEKTDKSNQAAYQKDHLPWSSCIYSRVAKMVHYMQSNKDNTSDQHNRMKTIRSTQWTEKKKRGSGQTYTSAVKQFSTESPKSTHWRKHRMFNKYI